MSKIKGPSIFVRLLALTLIVALLPLLGLGAAMINRNAATLDYLTRRLHLEVAADVRRAVEAQVERTREELTGIGQLLLAPGLGDDERRLALVGAKVTESGLFDAITLYDKNGQRALTVKAKEVPAQPAPQQLDPTLLRSLDKGQLIAGEILPGPKLQLFLPVHSGSEVRATLMAAISLDGLCALVGELGESRLQWHDAIFVVDEQRRLLVAADTARVAARESLAGKGIFAAAKGDVSFTNRIGFSPEFVEDGRAMLGAVEVLPLLGWAVVAREPRAEAYRSLDELRRSIALAVLAAALAALVGGALMSRRLTRPIAQLVLATSDLAARRWSKVAPEVTGRGDELGSLGRAFDHMSEELDRSEKQLVQETRARSSLSRYLSAEVVELVLHHPERMKLGGERREITVLFADVVAFTRLAETQPPEIIVALLNDLFTFATEIVEKRGGIIDKFIGDCVMAVWGTPESAEDDALRAVLAAEDLRRWLDTANRKWRQKFGVQIQMAMGINTGPAIAGNIGSEKRMEYTVIGDTVNLAARLEALAQPGQILLSETTRARVGDRMLLKSLGESAIHGRKGRTIVYEVPE